MYVFAPSQAAQRSLPAGGASGAERLLSGAGRQLFAGQLQLIHLPVAAFRRQQLLMGAPLDSLTSMQNQDGIGLHNGRQPMGNNHEGGMLADLRQRLLDRLLGTGSRCLPSPHPESVPADLQLLLSHGKKLSLSL